MKNKVNLRDDLTIARYGYSASALPTGSHKLVVMECSYCHAVIAREHRNRGKDHPCPTVVGSNKHCYKCDKWKDLSHFNKNGRLRGGVSKLCKQCYNNHEAVRKYERARCDRLRTAIANHDYEFYISRRAKRLESHARAKGITWSVTIDYLTQQWKKQDGLCYYTNLPMTGYGANGIAVWDSPSLDKMDPSKGYTEGNVVWCLYGVNSFKGELTSEQFAEKVNAIKWWCT